MSRAIKAAELLKKGAIFAFGLSERTHGADIYSTETALTPKGDGAWAANGEKYYIGNGNEAEMVSTLGKIKDGTDDYTFFVTNFHLKAYELKKTLFPSSSKSPTLPCMIIPLPKTTSFPADRISLGFITQHCQSRQIQYWLRIDRDHGTLFL